MARHISRLCENKIKVKQKRTRRHRVECFRQVQKLTGWLTSEAKPGRHLTPNILGFQLANTWPKITAHGVYAMVRNGKERKNLDFSSVAATVEKASTYVFAWRLIRNAEVGGSIPPLLHQ